MKNTSRDELMEEYVRLLSNAADEYKRPTPMSEEEYALHVKGLVEALSDEEILLLPDKGVPMDIASEVAKRLKLTQEETVKLRSTARIAGANSESQIVAVLAGIRKGAANVATAQESISKVVDRLRVDECPVCYAHMQPVTLAGARGAMFCPIHNVVMPSIE